MTGSYRFATSVPARLRGLLGTRPDSQVLVLAPCNDVHTFCMRYALDIAFANKRGVVVQSLRKVPSGCRVRCPEACVVLERAHDAGEPWFCCGQGLPQDLRRQIERRLK